MNAIETHALTKAWPGFTLEGLNLSLPSGSILGLIGENGAGKTTTIQLLLGMLRPDSGSVRVLGQERPDLERIGIVLDEPGFPQCVNAIQLGKILSSIYHNWNSDQYRDYLTRFRLPERKPYSDYSRGMKMKLGIAVALSHDPRLLILDEATSGLDPMVRDEILDIFNDFTREESHCILISSHIVSDLEKLCDYIAFLHRGRLMLFEEKDALYQHYGRVLCSEADFQVLAPEAVIGKKVSPYGVEAIVRREALPNGWQVSPVSIEDLFIFMAKEDAQ